MLKKESIQEETTVILKFIVLVINLGVVGPMCMSIQLHNLHVFFHSYFY